MSKAVLVMDMPESCQECPLKHDNYCEADAEKRSAYFHEIPDWCPLVLSLEKMLPDPEEKGNGFVDGWNACIDAITGEREEKDV